MDGLFVGWMDDGWVHKLKNELVNEGTFPPIISAL